jgi:hypothetical protein
MPTSTIERTACYTINKLTEDLEISINIVLVAFVKPSIQPEPIAHSLQTSMGQCVGHK